MAVVFARESGFHRFSQALARLILGLMIEKDIGPLMPAPAVHMDEYRSLISFFIFPAQAVYLGATLIQTAYLAEGDRTTHTSFPFAVIEELLVTYSVLCVLDDNMYLCASR
mgnify:FL=1